MLWVENNKIKGEFGKVLSVLGYRLWQKVKIDNCSHLKKIKKITPSLVLTLQQ